MVLKCPEAKQNNIYERHLIEPKKKKIIEMETECDISIFRIKYWSMSIQKVSKRKPKWPSGTDPPNRLAMDMKGCKNFLEEAAE